MRALVLTPQIEELRPLVDGLCHLGYAAFDVEAGAMRCAAVPALGLVAAVGGHGKSQFAIQSQYLIDRHEDATTLLCVGAAGRLADGVDFGDVVVATETVEHDYKLRFVREPSPCHEGDPALLAELRDVVRRSDLPFRVHFGRIASGDEDVVDPVRARELRDETGALCVAWEGSGGARAACFNSLSFLEIRCITDGADAAAAASFHENLEIVMPNVAALLVRWRTSRGRAESREEP